MQPQQTGIPYKGMPKKPLVVDEQRRRGDGEAAPRGAVRLGGALGPRGPRQPPGAQGRLHADGLHARLPEDQPAENPLRTLHQRGGHGAEAQIVRHRHPGLEGPVPRRAGPHGQDHQAERHPLPGGRRTAQAEHRHVIQRCRAHDRRARIARPADVRARQRHRHARRGGTRRDAEPRG